MEKLILSFIPSKPKGMNLFYCCAIFPLSYIKYCSNKNVSFISSFHFYF